MVGDSDVENLAHLVEFGNPSFDQDENRRREAVDALGSLTDQRAIVPLEGALQDENGRVRVSAVSALERHKACDSLFTALHSKDNEVRRAAAEALGQLGTPSAVLPLIGSLDDDDRRVQLAAVKGLVHLGEPSIDALIRTLQSTNKNARRAAAEALGQLGTPSAVLPLISVLRDQDWHVRFAGACALKQLNDLRSLDPFIHALETNRPTSAGPQPKPSA